MAYTTVAQIRTHLLPAAPVHTTPLVQQLTLAGTDWLTFFSGQVQPDSLSVGAFRNDSLLRRTLALIDGQVTLPEAPILPKSLVVASDSSLGLTYIENADYVVDYASGTLARKPGSALAAGQTITVWYRKVHRYAVDEDFLIDAERGRIRRLAAGSIADGETVSLSYLPRYGVFPDDLIEQAAATANRLIEATIDPQKQFGADPVLAQAAAYAAMATICRAAASRDLLVAPGRDRNATVWLTLADRYREESTKMLAAFRPPTPRPKPPQLT